MNKLTRILSIVFLSTVFNNAFAGTAPTIISACSHYSGNVISISGMVTDPELDTVAVGPLILGICADGPLPNYANAVSYNCNVPNNLTSVTLVAVDAETNFSAPVFFDLSTVPSCEFF